MAAAAAEEEGEENLMPQEEGMVALRSQEGVDFVVPSEEARLSMFLHRRIELDPDNYFVPADGDETKYTPILLRSIRAEVLSKVLEYCKQSYASCRWDGAHHLNHNETLYDLILASDYLEVHRLLDLSCQTLANKIKGKSPREIGNILNITGVFAPELNEEHSSRCCTTNMVTAAMEVISKKKPSVNQELKLAEKALQALDVVRRQEFTAYDPVLRRLKRNRVDIFNLAFFDIYKETSFSRGPQLHKITPMHESVVRSCVNVIYIKDDMLSLMDPCRGLVPEDKVYFEVDLKIKCDGGMIKDFSKGVGVFDWIRLYPGKERLTFGVYSHISTVEFLCEQVYSPVEATIAINILKGSCSISRVVASTPGNFKDHIILYEAACSPIVIESGGSVPLTRRVVAVSLDHKLALFIVGGDVLEHLALTLGHSHEVVNRRMGCAELEVKVAWTSVPVRERPDMFKVVGNTRLLL
ncbi:hypothetical protein CFC21_049182 [Triticum aestivum]|uniref:SKP1 component POZ domain-containing protein n=2 Tax=Triticum aestivum TaxID=4565 RepID=A0A9R1G2S0_WHEAT|nr:hypothetical protein CFC21_049182 [Triticum aestivum]